VDELISPREAVARVAGDVQVVTRPLYYYTGVGSSQVAATDGASGGERVPLPDQRVVLRRPTVDDDKFVALGVVSGKWHPASYVDLAEALDELGQKYRVETAGVLNKGGLCFLSLRAPDWSTAGGDEMRSYFIVNLSLTPGKAHKVMHAPVRVVCWNTNTMAEGQASFNLSIPHSADAKQRIGLAGNLVARFAEMQTRTKELFNAFERFKVTGDDVDLIWAAAWPEPPLPSRLKLLKETLTAEQSAMFSASLDPQALAQITQDQQAYERRQERRTALISEAGRRFDQFEPTAQRRTLWAAYNTVTEMADWRQGRAADQGSLWGERAREKARAFAAATDLAGLN